MWPSSVNVNDGQTAYFQITLQDGYKVATIRDSNMNTYTADATGLVAIPDVKKDIELRFEFVQSATDPVISGDSSSAASPSTGDNSGASASSGSAAKTN